MCVGSPGDLLDAVVRVGDARDLRQVRDRDHLRALGEPLQRRGDGVGRLAADARVDLVEDQRLATADRGDRERDAGELAARRRLGDGAERQPGVGADQEDGLVDAGRAGIALAQLDAELALAHADAAELLGDRFGEGAGRLLPRGAERVDELSPTSTPRRPAASAAAAAGSSPPSSASSSSRAAAARASSSS